MSVAPTLFTDVEEKNIIVAFEKMVKHVAGLYAIKG